MPRNFRSSLLTVSSSLDKLLKSSSDSDPVGRISRMPYSVRYAISILGYPAFEWIAGDPAQGRHKACTVSHRRHPFNATPARAISCCARPLSVPAGNFKVGQGAFSDTLTANTLDAKAGTLPGEAPAPSGYHWQRNPNRTDSSFRHR